MDLLILCTTDVSMKNDDQVQDQGDQEEDPLDIAFDLTTDEVVNNEALMEVMVFSQEKFAEQ